jgi:hypothetical protein
MIETVDPADTAKLDEIDARFLCYFTGCAFISREENIVTCQKSGYTYKETLPLTAYEYTRCRSALKTIRPKGWRFWVHSDGTCEAVKRNDHEDQEIISQAHTEELAELQAII